MASNARRRGRQRIPRGALEARLQLHHPGIELGRLRLLLVDRDFTGEGEFDSVLTPLCVREVFSPVRLFFFSCAHRLCCVCSERIGDLVGLSWLGLGIGLA